MVAWDVTMVEKDMFLGTTSTTSSGYDNIYKLYTDRHAGALPEARAEIQRRRANLLSL